jgi:hypothetical protein
MESPGIIDGHVGLSILLAFFIALEYAVISSFVLLQMCFTVKRHHEGPSRCDEYRTDVPDHWMQSAWVMCRYVSQVLPRLKQLFLSS